MNTLCHIAILYTGGTIGMKSTPNGLTPATDLQDLASPILHEFSPTLHIDWHVSQPLIDSSSVTLSDWTRWLNWLDQYQDRYDGFLILHGTDTLAYSANLLAIARPLLHKPVILTGSLWPFSQQNSDAPLNLRTALAAFSLNFQETAIAFNGKLWRAVGSTKVSTQCADGFQTPHFPPLGYWSSKQGWHTLQLPSRVQILENSQKPLIYKLNKAIEIHCFTLTPGANIQMITDSLSHHLPHGVVLQTYGNGNMPDYTPLMRMLTKISQQGIPILNISQVLQGCVSNTYAQGQALQSSGVINAGQCNLETALALLTIATSNQWHKQQIIDCLQEHQLLSTV